MNQKESSERRRALRSCEKTHRIADASHVSVDFYHRDG